jgi:hypothetical protein
MADWSLLLVVLAGGLAKAICWGLLFWLLMDWAEKAFGRCETHRCYRRGHVVICNCEACRTLRRIRARRLDLEKQPKDGTQEVRP